MADPDDLDLMSGLRSAPPSSWRTLWDAVDGLDRASAVEHSVELAQVVVALYEVRAVAPFDWMTWHEARPYPDGVGIESAPIDDVVRMLTVIVRSDRFSDGSLQQAADSGLFGSLLRRLRDWHDSSVGPDHPGSA